MKQAQHTRNALKRFNHFSIRIVFCFSVWISAKRHIISVCCALIEVDEWNEQNNSRKPKRAIEREREWQRNMLKERLETPRKREMYAIFRFVFGRINFWTSKDLVALRQQSIECREIETDYISGRSHTGARSALVRWWICRFWSFVFRSSHIEGVPFAAHSFASAVFRSLRSDV